MASVAREFVHHPTVSLVKRITLGEFLSGESRRGLLQRICLAFLEKDSLSAGRASLGAKNVMAWDGFAMGCP